MKKTRFELLLDKANLCSQKAIEFAQNNDWKMVAFYKRASDGFKIKAMNLTVEKGKELVEV